MEKFIRLLFNSLAVFLLLTFLKGENLPLLKVNSDYILYSEEQNYLLAAGKVRVEMGEEVLHGGYFYFDLKEMKGYLLGKVQWKEKELDGVKIDPVRKKITGFRFENRISISEKENLLSANLKYLPELRKGEVFYEATEVVIFKNGKITGKNVVPFFFGIPSMPVAVFILRGGQPQGKVNLMPDRIRFSQQEGLSLGANLVFKSFYKGSYNFRLYEKELFSLGEPSRGVILEGEGQFRPAERLVTGNQLYFNSYGGIYQASLFTELRAGSAAFRLTQAVSGQQGQYPFYWLASSLRLSPLPFMEVNLRGGWDYRKSYNLGFSTSFKHEKKLLVNFRWERNVFFTGGTSFKRETSGIDFKFSPAFFMLKGNFTVSSDLIEKTKKKDLILNLDLKPFSLVEGLLNVKLSSFFLFSSFAYAGELKDRVSPGFILQVEGTDLDLFGGIKVSPSFFVNQIWERRRTSWTEFTTGVSLKRKFSYLLVSFDATLLSRLKTDSFLVEGYNRTYFRAFMNFNWRNLELSTRLYWKGDFFLESAMVGGDFPFFVGFKAKFFAVYNNYLHRFTSAEFFLERIFRDRLKFQLGYSMTLKKFFMRAVLL